MCRRVAVAHGRDIIIGSLQQQAQLWRALLGNKLNTAPQRKTPSQLSSKESTAQPNVAGAMTRLRIFYL